MSKQWTESRGPILARSSDVDKANAICQLLTRPIALLPGHEGDPIKPFAIGLWQEFRDLLKPGASVTALRRATSAYTHSKRYYFALAQPDACRHDLEGNPIHSIGESDRLLAQQKYQELKGSPPPLAKASEKAPDVSLQKVNLIRAGIFRRDRPSL